MQEEMRKLIDAARSAVADLQAAAPAAPVVPPPPSWPVAAFEPQPNATRPSHATPHLKLMHPGYPRSPKSYPGIL